VRRLTLAAAGVVPFLVTCPLLFRGGSHDGDIPVFRDYGDLVTSGQVPYRDFHLEYPPGAVALFTLPSLGPEHSYLVLFQLLAAAGVVLGLILLALLVERLGAHGLLAYGALAFAGIAPALLGAFSLRRFDMWPAAICIGVLLLLLSERPLWAFGLLAAGVLVKTYPIALLPLALLFVERQVRLRALAVFCAVGLAVLGPFAAIGHVGLYESYTVQINRHIHIDTIGSSVLLALHRPVRVAFDGGGWAVFGGGAGAVTMLQDLAQVAGIVAAVVLFARSRRGPWDLVGAAVTILAVAACFGKVLTPQFLLWVAPLVVLSRSLVATALLAAAMLATNLLFPDRYGALLARHDGEIWLLVTRNALLVGMVAALFARSVWFTRRGELAPR
jgi:hypothetical protein